MGVTSAGPYTHTHTHARAVSVPTMKTLRLKEAKGRVQSPSHRADRVEI